MINGRQRRNMNDGVECLNYPHGFQHVPAACCPNNDQLTTLEDQENKINLS